MLYLPCFAFKNLNGKDSAMKKLLLSFLFVFALLTAVYTVSVSASESVTFFDSSTNLQIEGLGKSDSVYAKVNLDADEFGNATMILAQFDSDGNLISPVTIEKNVAVSGEYKTKSVVVYEETKELKVFVWDDLTKMYPILKTPGVTSLKHEKFELKFKNTDKYLYRIGNENAVDLSSLFAAADNAKIGKVTVKVQSLDEATNVSYSYKDASDWTKGTLDFDGTGPVRITICDEDSFSVSLNVEVIEAKNATSATDATSNNVVLLNDISGGFTVSGRYAVYGNGFTCTYTGDGRYLNNGLKYGVITVSENGVLDNLRINSSVYPVSYLYYTEVQKGEKEVDGDKNRYFYQFSAVAASDNATISNCYIYGGRNNIFVNNGNVTIKDSVLECGTLANVQIQSGSDYTVTFENVTTIQHQMNPTIGNTSNVMFGAGVIVGPETNDNPTIVLNGSFKQYNWVNSNDSSAVTNSTAKSIINTAVSTTAFNHTINDKKSSNLGIIYLNSYQATVVNNTGMPYDMESVTLMTQSGQVYSLKNATSSQIYSDYNNADKSTVNSLYQPQFEYADKLGGQYIAKTDEGDEFCYREGDTDTIKVMFPSGDTKELDLAKLVNITKYSDQDLNLEISCRDSNNSEIPVNNGKISISAAGDYTVTYSVTDTKFFDKDGEALNRSDINYSWDVIVSVSLKDVSIPDARFAFDTSKQVIYRSGNSNIKQFIPFLAGLKIYDYNGQTEYLRFDGDNDFNKVAKASINNVNTSGEAQGYHIVTVELTDGGKLVIDMDVRANSGSSTHTGSIKVRNNVLYVVNGGTTSGKGQTWKIYSYKFIGNNGTEINSGAVTFGTAGVDCDTATTPSSNFGTTVKYTVTYNANGGDCGQSVGYATSVSSAVTLPTPKRSGYIFVGWHTATSGGTMVGGAGDGYTPTSNITLYAQWGKPCTVTYNANGGNCDTASATYNGTTLTLPTPTRDGYWFTGWYDAATGGNKIGDAGTAYNPMGEITLYAHWQEAIKYTVTYNPNSGECSTASATYEGTTLTLPTPSKTGNKFLGWYDAATGGTKIGDAGAEYIPTANITLYAQWEKIAYTITVSTSSASVTGVTNGQTAYYGDTINFKVTYSESDSQTTTVKDANGNTVTTTGEYTFTMPASDVTITASSKTECITPETLITLADGTQKEVQFLTGEEELLVWNLETGSYDSAPIVFVDSDEERTYEVIDLYFSDNSKVGVIYEHGFFDIDLGEYVYITADNAKDYIGHSFVKQADIDNNMWDVVTLEDVVIENRVTKAYSPVTFEHLCYYTDGMLSMPGGIDGLFNIFEVDTKIMAYDAEKKAADIAAYGLFTYADFEGVVSEIAYEAFNGDYLKVAIGKGMLTWEDIEYLAWRYMPLVK